MWPSICPIRFSSSSLAKDTCTRVVLTRIATQTPGEQNLSRAACWTLRLAAAALLAPHLVPPEAEESLILPLVPAARLALVNATGALPH
jgi:hypothetical protein